MLFERLSKYSKHLKDDYHVNNTSISAHVTVDKLLCNNAVVLPGNILTCVLVEIVVIQTTFTACVFFLFVFFFKHEW